MSINPTTQVVLLIYEYLYSKGNRLEKRYLDLLDLHYKHMLHVRPERVLRDDDLIELIRCKSEFDLFMQIQREMYEILKEYRPGSVGNPDK